MTEKSLDMIIKENGYEYVCEIGRGGFSYCYKVFSPQYQQFFVCKVMSTIGSNCESRRRSFLNEINTLGHLTHPNIIHIYQIFETESNLFLILEYCPNGDYMQLVLNNGPLESENVLLGNVSKILDGLVFLEMNNIAHKDIKPSNILIDEHGQFKHLSP